MIKELSPKEDISNGELFQILILERDISHDFNDFDFREVQQNMHKVEDQWVCEEKNYEGDPTIHYKNHIGKRDQRHHKPWNNFPVKQNSSVRSVSQYYKHDKSYKRKKERKNSVAYSGNEYIKCWENRLGLSFHSHLAELQRFQTKEKIYEYNQVEKSIKYRSSVSPLQRISPSVKTNICNKYGKIFTYASLLTQHQKTYIREKPFKYNDCRKAFSHCST